METDNNDVCVRDVEIQMQMVHFKVPNMNSSGMNISVYALIAASYPGLEITIYISNMKKVQFVSYLHPRLRLISNALKKLFFYFSFLFHDY